MDALPVAWAEVPLHRALEQLQRMLSSYSDLSV
jgi:hypothetical protein